MAAKLWASTVVVASLLAGPASAGLSKANLSWTGDAGYTVEGVLTYDDTLPVVSAEGWLYGDFNNGLEDFTLTLRNATGGLIGTYDQVVSGVVVFDTLLIAFNTSDLSWVAPVRFEAGWWSSNYRDGEFFSMWQNGSVIDGGVFDANGTIYDSGGPALLAHPAPDPVPVPATLALLGAGLMMMRMRRYRPANP